MTQGDGRARDIDMRKARDQTSVDGENRIVIGRHGYRYLYNRHDTYIGASLEAYGEFSGAEADLLESLLAAGDFVVDVGANIGVLSLGMAKKIGPRGHLFAFEAQRIVFQMLCANVALNSLGNVDCHWMALGAERGTLLVPELDFSRRANFGSLSIAGQKEGRAVPCGTLDGMSELPRVSLIKIDVEGMELDVIHGGRALIAKHRPILYVENDRRDKSPQLIGVIGSLGYEMYWHKPRMFRKENYRNNIVDIFEGTVSQNMLCLPRERTSAPVRLQRVSGFLDWPE